MRIDRVRESSLKSVYLCTFSIKVSFLQVFVSSLVLISSTGGLGDTSKIIFLLKGISRGTRYLVKLGQ